MEKINYDAITVDPVRWPVLEQQHIAADIIRLDKIHPLISGNKWFKLRYYLEDAALLNKRTIITFGGAWSNHILATAAICEQQGFQSIGIIRGEEPLAYSPTLQYAKKLGMQFFFSNREDYRDKIIPAELAQTDHYLIPEGGYGDKGAAGAATIFNYCNKDEYSHVLCAAGTGTMTAGLINGASLQQEIISISVLKNNRALETDLHHLLKAGQKKYYLSHDYHFGGYAKHNSELISFMNSFFLQTGIQSDFVYTGKLFFAMSDLARQGYFSHGSKLLIVHSGGLQGNASLGNGTLIF